jgi:hypothetical protein
MARPPRSTGSRWTRALIRNTLLLLIPVTVVWLLATPVYNRMLLSWSAGILHVFEHPRVTELPPRDPHHAYIQRLDFPPAKSLVFSFRVSDLHFPLILLGALFLAVPKVPWRERLANLGLAVFATALFDIALVILYVKFCYSNQLGAWSLAHYGVAARNLYGLAKHLFDLPFKLALPLLLWCGFYLPRMRSEMESERPA